MSEPGLRERKKLETRHRLATTALGLFMDRGFDEVSVAEVAEAAGVSKMTVFNHFPAKEDLVFELTADRGLPDLAAAVRGRAPGESAIAAVRREARREFERQAEESDYEERMAAFIRMVFRSPTLLQGFGRRWITVQNALAVALAEETGQPVPRGELEHEFFRAVRDELDPAALEEILRATSGPALRPHAVAAQLVSALQQVTMLNLVRRLSGVDRKQSASQAIADLDATFDLLESGLATYAIKA